MNVSFVVKAVFVLAVGSVMHGQWNEQKETMTSTMKSADGDITTTTADFSKAGEENWTVETRHADNSLAFRMHGKNTRRK